MFKGWKTLAVAWALFVVGTLTTSGVEARVILTVASAFMIIMRAVTDGFATELKPEVRRVIVAGMVFLQAIIATAQAPSDPLPGPGAPTEAIKAQDEAPGAASVDVLTEGLTLEEAASDRSDLDDVLKAIDARLESGDEVTDEPTDASGMTVGVYPATGDMVLVFLVFVVLLWVMAKIPTGASLLIVAGLFMTNCGAAWTAADAQALCRTTAKSIAITHKGVAPNGAKITKGQAEAILEADCSVFKRHKCSESTPYYVPAACD